MILKQQGDALVTLVPRCEPKVIIIQAGIATGAKISARIAKETKRKRKENRKTSLCAKKKKKPDNPVYQSNRTCSIVQWEKKKEKKKEKKRGTRGILPEQQEAGGDQRVSMIPVRLCKILACCE